MLSTSTIKNVSQASHYFSEQDNYYTQDEGFTHSEWWGKGARDMQLNGVVSDQRFTALLNGVLPSGEQLGKMENNVIKHRAGWDLTFSAPKSVSIMALVAGDQRLIAAHREAVKATLEKIEVGCGQARMRVDGAMSYVNTQHLTGALYHHDLSRARDPQLHTHSVIMNMTARADGKWRSLASSLGKYNENATNEVNGFIERVRHHNRYYSKLYETELAFQVKQCGYELRHDSKTGVFEIADIPASLIDHFSKRRQEIEAMLETNGLAGGKAAAMATLFTRENKGKVDRGALKQQWLDEGKLHGIDLNHVKEKSIEKQLFQNSPNMRDEVDVTAVTIVKAAIKQLAVFQSNFSLEQIIELSTKEAITKHCHIQSLIQAIRLVEQSGHLMSIANQQQKSLYMAKSTLEDENTLITNIKDNQMKNRVVSDAHLSQFLSQHAEIALSQHSLLAAVFDQTRLVLLDGENTKNQLIEPIMKVARSAELKTVILSPSTIGSYRLAKQMQPTPQSLWEHVKALFVDTAPTNASVMHFLSSISTGEWSTPLPKLLLVDQVNLLSTYQKSKLVAWAKDQDAKIIFFGNKDHLLPHQVSTSLQQLIDHGVKPIHLPDAGISELTLSSNTLRGVVDKLMNQTIEVKHQEDRHLAMVEQYARLKDADRRNVRLVAATKADVEKMNQLTHDKLKIGHARGVEHTIETLFPVFIPSEKAVKSTSYTTNQVLRFNQAYPSLGISKGEYLRVSRISHHSNRLLLLNAKGDRIIWRPDKIGLGENHKIELFDCKAKNFQSGDQIKLTRSMKQLGLVKGERLQIEKMTPSKMIVRNEFGKDKTLDLTKSSQHHFDYGYAATLHEIGHERPTMLIADIRGSSLSTHQRKFNQLLSQTKDLWVYTDDSNKLATTLARQTGTPLSAGEVLAKSEQIKSSLHAIYDLVEAELAKAKPGHQQAQSKRAFEAVDYAMSHLTERQAGFTHKDLILSAMEHALGNVTEKTLTDVTLAMEKSGVILRSSRSDGTFWTTAEAVKLEREITTLTRQDIGKMSPIADSESVRNQLANSNLRSEQKDAIISIVTSTDRVLSIQGRAGTGKTTMMMSLDAVLSSKELLNESGYSLRGIAPTNKAVKELMSRGIESQTIDSFLLEVEQQEQKGLVTDYSRTLFVLDEASMVSNRKMLSVLQVAHRLNFNRLIPTGDIHQNPSIEAGKPHDLMQRSLDRVIHLNDIQRQQNPTLKSAALALYEHKIEQTFSLLSSNIIEICRQGEEQMRPDPSYHDRIRAIVKDYFASRAKDSSVQIIAPSHDDRRMINQAIREELQHSGELEGESHTFSILTSKDMTRAERTFAGNFKVGDVLRFVASQNKKIQANDYFEIRELDHSNNLLTLASLSGNARDVYWQIPASTKQIKHVVEAYHREERRLQVGDQLVWMKTDKKQNLLSADIAKVVRIEQGKITTQNHEGRETIVDAMVPTHQHWDHAYALTTYSTQGGTYGTVLGFFETSRLRLMNLKTFLVTITRAVHGLRLYTDNKEKLQALVSANHGDKLSSLEVIGEYPSSKKKELKASEIPSQNRPKDAAKSSMQSPRFDRLTVERVIEGVNKDAEKIAISLLGEPKVRGGYYLKFGSNQGSLSVTVKGEKQGWWHDFSEGKGGRSMLSFIQHHTGLDKKEAIDFGAKWVGISLDAVAKPLTSSLKNKHPSKPEATTLLSKEDKRKLAFARKLADQSQPIAGTLVERYLKEHRGVGCHADDIRYHEGVYSKLNGKSLPAMLVIARDHKGNVRAVQATFLDPVSAKKIDKSEVAIQKQTFGLMKGASVALAGEKGAPTLISEGVETGLSLKQALPEVSVKITLSKSNFSNIDTRSLSQRVILCLDQDGADIKSDKQILGAAKRLLDAGKQVGLMIPTATGQQKIDYNDVIKSQGTIAIKQDFNRVIPAEVFYASAIKPTQSTTELSQKVDVLARQMNASDERKSIELATAHRAITRNQPSSDSIKPTQKTVDIERGI